jgi:hypothetical protein
MSWGTQTRVTKHVHWKLPLLSGLLETQHSDVPFISVYPPEVFKLSIWESRKTVSLYYALVAQCASHECIIGRLCQSLHLLLHLVASGRYLKVSPQLNFICIGKTSTRLYKTWGLGPFSPRHCASSCCGWREGFQIWRLAANVSNKQSQTADKGRPSSLGVGCGANNTWP